MLLTRLCSKSCGFQGNFSETTFLAQKMTKGSSIGNSSYRHALQFVASARAAGKSKVFLISSHAVHVSPEL